jgi:hypothetical protein
MPVLPKCLANVGLLRRLGTSSSIFLPAARAFDACFPSAYHIQKPDTLETLVRTGD